MADMASLEGSLKNMYLGDGKESVHRLLNDDISQMGDDADVLPKFKVKRTAMPSHIDSSQICEILNPTRGIRDLMQRKGIAPRNHAKDNREAIARRSAMNHAIKEVASRSEKPTVPRPHKIRTEKPPEASVKDGGTDFLAKNFKEASKPPRKNTGKAKPEPHLQNENFGRIPAYLIKRKIELAHQEEQRLLAEESKHIAPGMVLLPDDERDEVLKTLEEKKSALEKQLRGLPLVLETPSQKRAKAEAESKLSDIEEGIKRFSRSKVYISIND